MPGMWKMFSLEIALLETPGSPRWSNVRQDLKLPRAWQIFTVELGPGETSESLYARETLSAFGMWRMLCMGRSSLDAQENTHGREAFQMLGTVRSFAYLSHQKSHMKEKFYMQRLTFLDFIRNPQSTM